MVMTGQRAQSVLVIEDDEDTAEMVCNLLETAGYEAVAVSDGGTALDEIAMIAPDLVLLDIHLPDINGLEILKKVRSHSFLPMIVMSGYERDRDRVVALEAGADDFMAKPFAPDELVARVKALLRRVDWTPKPETQITVRKLELNLPRRQATINGKRLSLTPIEYNILLTLMRHAGKVISHDELLQAVWGDSYRGDYSVLRVNVSK